MKWSKHAWDAISQIFAKTIAAPFICELTSGELHRDKFIFYIKQDALYLVDFGKTLAAIASKLDDSAQRHMMLGFASESIAVEQALHRNFFAQYGVDHSTNTVQSPACLLYTSYILRQAAAPVEIAMASVLPCFWIYMKVGDYIKSCGTSSDNPYRAWIETYGGEEYAHSVAKAVELCDALAESCTAQRRSEMTEAFIACSRMEWMFWDSAYKLETWPL